MGFFSANCHGCSHPLLSTYAVNNINFWMNDVVGIAADGSIATGTYDGYGRIEQDYPDDTWDDDADIFGRTVWHQACWEVAGKPTTFHGESPSAEDQGWFFDEEDHALADPRGNAPADFDPAFAGESWEET